MSEIAEILSRFPANQKQYLIPVAQKIQEKMGYLSASTIYDMASYMGLSAPEVHSILSFYPQFRFKPRGKFHIEVCRYSVCRMNQSETIVSYLEKLLGIKVGETSPDLLFSLSYGSCKGVCAPHIRINQKIFRIQSLEDVKAIIQLEKNNV